MIRTSVHSDPRNVRGAALDAVEPISCDPNPRWSSWPARLWLLTSETDSVAEGVEQPLEARAGRGGAGAGRGTNGQATAAADPLARQA